MVDEENKLVGVITVDDVIDVIKDEATEDIYRLAGVAGDERAFTPAGESLRKRLPWLGVNLVTAFLAASVVALFEGTIERITALAVFMPIVAGMGGNAATQTLTVIVRGIALGELTLEQFAQGAAQGSAGRHRQRRRARRWSRRSWRGPRAATRCSGLVLGAAMIINMFVAATAGHAGAARAARGQHGPGAGVVGVHHDDDRRLRVLLVPRPGDRVRCAVVRRGLARPLARYTE